MLLKALQSTGRQVLRTRWSLVLLLAFVLLLGAINWLLVNQRVVLYVFYVPVVFAAWFLPKRHAVSTAVLAAAMVVAFAWFLPGKLVTPKARPMLWADLTIWGGVLVLTAYMVSTLRLRAAEAMRELRRAYMGVVAILSRFIQTVDADTEAHSVRVSTWAVRIAEALGLDRPAVEETRIAGLLHDVGKVEVSVELLRKAAALSETERGLVREHAARGAELVKPVGGMLSNIADAVECHHEKYDGSGYKGLRGEEIPLVARIIAVADAFDALVSDRPYRKGVGVFEAMDKIAGVAGTHFDPAIAAALQKILAENGELDAAGLLPIGA